jgi:hypothetical protein
VGDSLDVVLRDGGLLPIEDAVPLVDSLSAAIAHAAARGVHHELLHPRDIIVSPAGARITGFGIAAALAAISAKLPVRPLYSAPEAASDVYSLGAIAFEAITGTRVSPANLEEFRIAHGGQVGGALATVLAAAGLKAGTAVMSGRKASSPKEAVRTTSVAGASNVDTPAPDAHVVPAVRPAAQDLDLRIDRPVELSLKPPPSPDRAEDIPRWRGVRWPIVAAFLVFAALAALAAGFLLKSPAPVAVPDQDATVDETTVDLPANPPADPARASRPPLPAATPSRSASGAIARPQPTRGSLLIRSTPADADVMLNDSVRGKTPLVVRDLALGSYTIRVARDGYVTDERTLQLTPQRPTAATTFDLRAAPGATGGAVPGLDEPGAARGTREPGTPGSMTVQSRPAGARVFVNDRLVGSTPTSVADLPEGPATVRIELDGYQTWATTVRVGSGAQTRVAASLERK